MSFKEISVFIIGLILVGFLYLMKHPSTNELTSFSVTSEQSSSSDESTEIKQTRFNPNTKYPILDRLLDVPAWQFDLAEIGTFTSEEIIRNIKLAIEEKRYFQPEKNSALFYLVNLKSLDNNNENIKDLTNELTKKLDTLAQYAIEKSNENSLKSTIAKYKTLDQDNNKIIVLVEKLSNISTINKLYKKGNEQIQQNRIVSVDSNDAWHTAKQSIEIDSDNPKAISLVANVIDLLVNHALRAAEETDFQLAFSEMEQAQLLSPDSEIVNFVHNEILDLKQERYLWLEQQLSIAINRLDLTRANRMITLLKELGLQSSELVEYQDEIDRITIFGEYSELEIFSDRNQFNAKFPNMVVMPLGKYTMGATYGGKYEKPAHMITIDYGFAVSQNEITVAEFRLFIDQSNYKTDALIKRSSKIYDMRTGRLKNKNKITWEKNYLGKKSDDNNPVIHVSWNDAVAYTKWLSEQTGKNYRLLSESEFEYILRAGTKSYYPWGDGTPVQITENLTGKLDKTKQNTRVRWKKGFDKYNDKYWGPAPVGSFITNAFKLNDTAGNVMEWVMDCWHDSYTRAPIDGSSWTNPGCEDHVIRGGSWSSSKNEFISSHRFKARASFTDARLGFRIAVDLQ